MSEYTITDLRINGKRFYAVEKQEKISFYTSNIAAARYWIRAEENDPTLIKPFQNTGPDESNADASDSTDSINASSEHSPTAADAPKELIGSGANETKAESEVAPVKPVRIS
jgi:hypothetical protein